MRQGSNETVSAWAPRLDVIKSELKALSGDDAIVFDLSYTIPLVDRTLPSLTPGQWQADQSTFFIELRENMEQLSVSQIETRLIQRAEAITQHLAFGNAGGEFEISVYGRFLCRGRGHGETCGDGPSGGRSQAPMRHYCTLCRVDHRAPECPGKNNDIAAQLRRLHDKCSSDVANLKA